MQSKSQFCLNGVSASQTRFDYEVQSMSHTDAMKALDLIGNHPANNPHGHLKKHFLLMYALTDYARHEAISSLPLFEDMMPSTLMSKMLSLLPSSHEACFFLLGAFLKPLPADVQSPLVHNRTSDPLSLALCTDEIYQSRVSSTSAVNHFNSPCDECPVLAVQASPASKSCNQQSPTPGPCHHVHLPHLPPHPVQILLTSAGITGIMLIRLRAPCSWS